MDEPFATTTFATDHTETVSSTMKYFLGVSYKQETVKYNISNVVADIATAAVCYVKD